MRTVVTLPLSPSVILDRATRQKSHCQCSTGVTLPHPLLLIGHPWKRMGEREGSQSRGSECALVVVVCAAPQVFRGSVSRIVKKGKAHASRAPPRLPSLLTAIAFVAYNSSSVTRRISPRSNDNPRLRLSV